MHKGYNRKQNLVPWILNCLSKVKQGPQNLSCLGSPDVQGQPCWGHVGSTWRSSSIKWEYKQWPGRDWTPCHTPCHTYSCIANISSSHWSLFPLVKNKRFMKKIYIFLCWDISGEVKSLIYYFCHIYDFFNLIISFFLYIISQTFEFLFNNFLFLSHNIDIFLSNLWCHNNGLFVHNYDLMWICFFHQS